MSAESVFEFERLARVELHTIVRQYLSSQTTSRTRSSSSLELTLNCTDQAKHVVTTRQMVESTIADYLINLQNDLVLHKYSEWSVETESKIKRYNRTCREQFNTSSPLLFSFAYMASLLSTTTTTTTTATTFPQQESELLSQVLTEQSYSANRWKEFTNTEKEENIISDSISECNRVIETQCRHLLSFPDTLIALAVAAFTQCVQLTNEHEHITSSILERNSLLITNDNSDNTIPTRNGNKQRLKVNNNNNNNNYIDNSGNEINQYNNEEILQSIVNSALRNFSFDKDLYLLRLADAFWVFALNQDISCVAYTKPSDQSEEQPTRALRKEQSDYSYNDENVLHFTELSAKQVVRTFVICAMQRGVWQHILHRLKEFPFDKLQNAMSKECEETVVKENGNGINNDNVETENIQSNTIRIFVTPLINVLDAVIAGCSKCRQNLKSRTMHFHRIFRNITSNKNNSINNEISENKISTGNKQEMEETDRWSYHEECKNANVSIIYSCVHWQQTILTLFDLCNICTYEIGNEVLSFLRTMLRKAITSQDLLLANCLFHTICIDMTCHMETPRSLLKTIFTELITPLYSTYINKENIQCSETNSNNSTHEPSSSSLAKSQEEKQNIPNKDNKEDFINEKIEENCAIDSVHEQENKKTISFTKMSDCTKRVDDIIEHILHEWSDKDVVLSDSLKMNATIMNSVMYSMEAIHQVYQQKLPSKFLLPLLDGVHVRLECVRSPELRNSALIVSAAFASMFVEYEEIATGLMSNDQFAEALQGWLYEEQLLTCHHSRNNSIINIKNKHKLNYNNLGKHRDQINQKPSLELVLQDNSSLPQHSARSAMLNPDEPYIFYTNLHQRLHEEEQEAAEVSTELVAHERDHTDVNKVSHAKSVKENLEETSAEHDLQVRSHLAHELPSFGIKEHPLELSSNNSNSKSITNTTSLVSPSNNNSALTRVSKNKWLQSHSNPSLTLRGCYNVLMGIGRKPQSQQHEIEEDNELGLTELHKLLQLHVMEYCRFNQTSPNNYVSNALIFNGVNSHKSNNVCVAELSSMTSILIPFLVSVELHAPADVLARLHHIRFMCLVYIIMLCPRMALSALSNMVYGVNYGVAQRVEMIDAIGYAAYGLAHGTAFCSKVNSESRYDVKQNTSASNRNRNRTHDNANTNVHYTLDNCNKEEEYEKCTTQSRLIYPPIPSITPRSQSSPRVPKSSELSTLLPFSSLNSHKKVAIAVSEGKKTRRWGYTIHPRSSDADHHTLALTHRSNETFQQKLTHNMLSDYAENFIIVFLSRVENAPPAEEKIQSESEQHTQEAQINENDDNNEDEDDTIKSENNSKNNTINNPIWSYTTYHFWQTSDPYTPSSILRVFLLVVQSLSHVRHVISSLCARHVHFIIAVAHSHPHSAIRQLGWITLGEVMRAWCNAPPLFVATVTSHKNYTKGQYSKNKTTMTGTQANLHESTSSQRSNDTHLYKDHAVRLVHSSLLTPEGTTSTWHSHSLMLSASWLATYEAIHKLAQTTLQQSVNVESVETVNAMLMVVGSLQGLVESAHDRENYTYMNAESSPSIQIIN